MKSVTLSEKLILYFLCLGLGTIFLISIYSYKSTQQALMSRTFDQLTSLRIAKKSQVEIFFKDRIKDVLLLAGSDDTRVLAEQCDKFSKPEFQQGFSEFLDKYKSLTGYFTSLTITGISKNFISGHTAGSGIRNGREYNGPGLSGSDTAGSVTILDESLDPVSGKVKMFMEAPVFSRNGHMAGWIILELPPDAINRIMLNKDPGNGLGRTGETYLVGIDYRMRSDSRFIHNSILRTRVMTKPVISAIHGEEGQSETVDYRFIPVLSSYSSIAIPGLKWFILAEIDLKEAMIPISRMRNSLVLLSTLISVIFFFFVFIISKRITRPIDQLKEAVLKVGKGEYNIEIPVRSNDEIGSLTRAFNSMSRQIEEKTTELQSERMGRIRSVIDAEEQERQRLSRELHDGIGQSLVAQKLRMESLLYLDDKEIKEQINVLKDQSDRTIDEIRRISNNLMPSVLEVFGIVIALKNLCEETEEHTGIVIRFRADGQPEQISTRITTYLYRIAQEALNNIIRHSAAKEVELILARKEDNVTFIIRDDGKGFDREDKAFEKGNGLHNMRNRVALLQGTIDIASAAEKGTTIEINIPAF
ncbi:MAG: HAMP domain-containing protein [Bacteroidetes bacterium]|nr:HAMP domain-containing protein [Bacteroidota bacterium]